MKIPRDLSAKKLIKICKRHGYHVTRQRGSHIRLTNQGPPVHHITIPNHDTIKPGTLLNIINAVCRHLSIDIDQFFSR